MGWVHVLLFGAQLHRQISGSLAGKPDLVGAVRSVAAMPMRIEATLASH
jgi:hypothetical protein